MTRTVTTTLLALLLPMSANADELEGKSILCFAEKPDGWESTSPRNRECLHRMESSYRTRRHGVIRSGITNIMKK